MFTLILTVVAVCIGIGALLALVYVAGFFLFRFLPATFRLVRSFPDAWREGVENSRPQVEEIKARHAERSAKMNAHFDAWDAHWAAKRRAQEERIQAMKAAQEERIRAIKARFQEPARSKPKP